MRILPAIRIEGGFFSPDLPEQLKQEELPGQHPADFGLDGRRRLTDEIAANFTDARSLWAVFQRRLSRLPETDMATSVTRDGWMIPFLGLLDYQLRYNQRAYMVEGSSFAISHRAGEAENAPPIHIVGYHQELGKVSPTGRPRMAPHSLMQEFLNRTEHLWGIVTNGRILRVLRDSTYIRKQAYIEFDLVEILEEQRFEDFAVLYRLLHRSRLPRTYEDASQCLLEQYYQYSVEQGGRVREHLREGVEACILKLANGFLQHPDNVHLRRQLGVGTQTETEASSSPQAIVPLTAQELYQHLLHLVYRFLFLLVSEERGLIRANSIYRQHYGVSRLRNLVDSRTNYTDHEDIWHSLRVLWKVLSDEKMASFLQVAPLNGELFKEIIFDSCSIRNSDFLEAFWHLVYYQETPSAPPRKVNYSALDVEELGSVYESLLEFHPQVIGQGQVPLFKLIQQGKERRSTGSHYTPTELVKPLIKHALEPIIAERLSKATTKQEKEQALLSIKVCDMAAGSGHFLLAAARRLGKELARVQTGEEEPSPEIEREAIRNVIAHCIYGVDKNPLAVELCKVALWIEAHSGDKPLAFLDHHIKCGDSLVGVYDLEIIHKGIPEAAFKPLTGENRKVVNYLKRKNKFQRNAQHRTFWQFFNGTIDIQSFSQMAQELDQISDDSPQAIRKKKSQYMKLQQKIERYRTACNLWTAAFFQHRNESTPVNAYIITDVLYSYIEYSAASPQALASAQELENKHRFFHWPLEFPEVFAPSSGHGAASGGIAEALATAHHSPLAARQSGFDVIIGNPPFMGGLKISGAYGDHYRRWLQVAFAPFSGTADLCAAFFRQAFRLLKPGGRIGMIATNTLGQGDTRESGLAVILKQGGAITFARRFVKWPGQANVEVNLVAIHKRAESGEQGVASREQRAVISKPLAARHSPLAVLDDQPVDFISSRLDDMPEAEPRRLRQNGGKAFQGDIVRGIGFVLEPWEAEELIAKDPRNAECLFLYLNGQDLNSHPEQKPSRYVICFHDWPLEKAQEYPDLLRIVEERVKPERERLRGPGDKLNKEYWWKFGAYRQEMRRAITSLNRVLIRSRVSELHSLVFVPKGMVYTGETVVFAFDDNYHYTLLQSNIHEVWLRNQSSSLRTDIRYTPTTCFETFPFPQNPPAEARAQAEQVGAEYHEHRRQIMLARQLGLTKTYNLFHDPACTDDDIQRLRELHAEMDRAIARCYGWEELDLQHGFYENERGKTRFTISPEARREVLRRLVELNLEVAEREKGGAYENSH